MAYLSHNIAENTEFLFNFELIRAKNQDPKSCSGLKIVSTFVTGLGKIRVNILTTAFLILFLTASTFVPTTAQASGFFGWLFGPKVQAEEEKPNSQSTALALQAVNSPDLQATTSTVDVPIVDNSSLSADTKGSTDSKNSTPSADQISIYVVHKGDTLADIAKMFGVSKNTIVWANDLQGKSISVGQTLVILPISGVQHIVKKGDTLQSIAKLYKADLQEILQYNDLTISSKLAIGDEILIPDGEISPTQTTGSSKTNNAGVGTRGSSTPSYNGYYMRPIIGGIKTQGIHGHNGVDLASAYGSNIMASASGKVIIARSGGWNGGYGSYVVISHSNGTQTLYGHLSEVDVLPGDDVEQGQVIGKMGSTGKSTGTHLHFEIRGARNPF